ncbi:MAG TPA: ATP-binding protein [Candidatus Aminicenantes bacterium]|nr:ATP-binding protein [Candidatus Aminicenantes bacterium]HRY63958.1 ATP-binding protein [Candidatus Aminicenantes bacterium]HRZ70871.1 ATP-binding protein [Candidatus Aminicenantes bacterium]
MTIFGRIETAVRGGRRRNAPPWTIFREFTESLNLIEDFDQIAMNLLGTIREAAAIERLVLFVHDADIGQFRVAASSGYDPTELRGVFLSGEDRLAKWLKVNKAFLDIDARDGVMAFLGEPEKGVIARLGLALCYPVLSMNRLIGVLGVGRKGEKKRFGAEESAFIYSLMPQAGIALENALLYKEQKERFRRMLRADRLATIGELAAGAAHEIRNPLTSIRSSLQYVESRCREESERKLLGVALRETDRIDEILSTLLSFARPSEIRKEPLDLVALLEESAALVAIQARAGGVEIRTAFPPRPVVVEADGSQLKQVFLNVSLNAVQAMAGGGRLTVEVLPLEGGKAIVRFTDTGPGIPEEALDKVFDPFFTTKKGGTGLGLSICYAIVKAHGGEIELRSRPGEGTTVLVALPAGARSPA